MPRDYKNEYKAYHSKPEQREKNNSRKRARYALEKGGVVSKGDGKDVAHKDGNPLNNKRSNLKVSSVADNRSFPRTKIARKKNPKD